MLNVCLVTHNPRREVLRLVLSALRGQTLPVSQFRVVLIDNASQPPLESALLDELRAANIDCELLREERLGVFFGRLLAVRQAQSNPVLFVDDDNELRSDYLQVATELLDSHPQVGCFGGRMLLPHNLIVPAWTAPLLGALGIKDCGDGEVVDWLSPQWQAWQPTATAGLLVRPEVSQAFLVRYESNPAVTELGRKGTQLMSHEDYLLVHGARALGFKISYQPRLVLYHHLAPHRLRFGYLMKLMYGHGRSRERLAHMLGEPTGRLPYPSGGSSKLMTVLGECLGLLKYVIDFASPATIRVRACNGAYQLGVALERASQWVVPSPQDPRLAAFPRLAVVGGESLSATHGTGWVMGRQLQNYPRQRVLDIHFQRQGESLFPEMSLPVKYIGRLNSIKFELSSLLPRQWRSTHPPFVHPPNGHYYRFTPVPTSWRYWGGSPDILYSTAFNNMSMNFLEFVHERLPKKVPILQHFLDFQPEDEYAFRQAWRRVQPWVGKVWALTPRLANRLEAFLECEVGVVGCLHQHLQSSFKTTHRPLGPDFQTVMIGNLWQRELLPYLEGLWSSARQSLPELPKIRWYGASRRFDEAGIQPPDLREIEDGGLLPSEQMQPTLQQADLAILPFSAGNANDYARYSLPSRISDYCAAGLPVFALAGPGSQVWDYVLQHEIGRCACPSKPAEALQLLLEFLADHEARERAGRKARQLAEDQMELVAHQDFINQQIVRLAWGN